VASHLEYIGREGRGDIETDDGQVLHANGAEQILLKDWDLDLPARSRNGLGRFPARPIGAEALVARHRTTTPPADAS
jgi:hypothetical protein